jgi:NAD(P)-dependent dehydrogenase (short-subunit alcohol dehydrogenase family)
LAEAAKKRFGTIDILVNNAGLFDSLKLKSITDITTDEWNKVMQVNMTGMFHCTKAVVPHMKQNGGKIINMSSATFFEGVAGIPQYVASKGAIIAFTRVMARELGEFNIKVNCIAPGGTLSEGFEIFSRNFPVPPEEIAKMQMMQKCIKRDLYPEDLVGSAIFFASDDSSFITGQTLLHNGGMNFI